jgi:integrase/recombinase XerD
MQNVHWDHYPLVASNTLAQEWLSIQAKIGLAPNTVEAYGRSLNDFLAFSPTSCATRSEEVAKEHRNVLLPKGPPG